MEIEFLIRKNIRELKPYRCARDEYEDMDAVFLDANESPFENGFNRYPDPYQRCLKFILADFKQVAAENVILGNGSDELIDLLIRSLCRPGIDNIIVFSPGYTMYEVCAAINDVEVRKINLTVNFLPDWRKVEQQRDCCTKIIFLCTPHNPVGNIIPLSDIENLCKVSDCMVVVDEAYIDFTDMPSAIGLLERYENLFVLQTLSKAWGMAGLRLGMGFANEKLIAVLNRVKPPYNIGVLAQQTAVRTLKDRDGFRNNVACIRRERERLLQAFLQSGIFEKVYPSEANFILVTSPQADELYRFLLRNGIVTRLRNIPPLLTGGIRITVGNREENDRLLGLLACWTNKLYPSE